MNQHGLEAQLLAIKATDAHRREYVTLERSETSAEALLRVLQLVDYPHPPGELFWIVCAAHAF